MRYCLPMIMSLRFSRRLPTTRVSNCGDNRTLQRLAFFFGEGVIECDLNFHSTKYSGNSLNGHP